MYLILKYISIKIADNPDLVPYFTDYRSMGTIGRIAAFRLNFWGNTKIGRGCRWQLG